VTALSTLDAPSAPQRRRLREVWRSAGWPCHDTLELELLAAGWLQRRFDPAGRETLHLSDSGVAVLAAAHQRAQRALTPHETLVAVVARQMQRAGRIVWRRLSLRAPLEAAGDAAAADSPGDTPPAKTQWVMAMPDVYSIRHTTLETALEPIVHEIKVSRADLLSDLRHEAKGRAYRALAGEVWYVVREGLCRAEEIPPEYGLLCAHGPAHEQLELVRPAPRRPMQPGFALWMALARANAEPPEDEPAQVALGAGAGPGASAA
jgi:hypothetical protein